MFQCDKEKCIKCGMCKKVCSYKTGNIVIDEEGVSFKEETCFHCGHCIAICPQKAISNDEYDSAEWIEKEADTKLVDPKALDFTIKYRRSNRCFTEKVVTKEEIQQVIEAGRYAPSGGNRQKIRYVVLQDKLEEFRKCIVDNFDRMIQNGELQKILEDCYIEKWKEIIAEDRAGNRVNDRFLFHGSTVILVCGPDVSMLEAGMACQNMDLTANAMGLGCCYVGFIKTAFLHIPELRSIIGLEEDEKILSSIVIGYPAISYKRTTIKKKVDTLFL